MIYKNNQEWINCASCGNRYLTEYRSISRELELCEVCKKLKKSAYNKSLKTKYK